MRLIWMAVPALPALLAATIAGCSGEESSNTAATSAVLPSSTAAQTTVQRKAEEPGNGVRIAIGETRTVLIPSNAVMEITAPADWGEAASGLRCTVTDITGRNEDLRSSDVKKRVEIGGSAWITLWTFSSPPATEVTVGCKDPGGRIQGEGAHDVRVAPRAANPN